MPFVGDIFAQLKAASNTVVLQEIRDGQISGVTGAELLELVRKARTFLASKGLNKGDRCGLLAANSIRWIAMDLAAMAEGLIVVPLYFRQAPAELVAMMKDSTPSCSSAAATRRCATGFGTHGLMPLTSSCSMRYSRVLRELHWIVRRFVSKIR